MKTPTYPKYENKQKRLELLKEMVLLWQAIVDNPEWSDKEAAENMPELRHILDYRSECPACQYDEIVLQDLEKAGIYSTECRHCAIEEWRNAHCFSGTYAEWKEAQLHNEFGRAAELADRIAELAETNACNIEHEIKMEQR